MPFDVEPSAVAVQQELETGRQRWTVSLEHAHWTTCPGAKTFRKRG